MTLLFLSHILYSTLIDCLIFNGWAGGGLLVCLNFTACADQLLYNLSLIKLCSACTKQNETVKATSDTCSFLAK